jgi:hypothetical protein
MDTRWDPPRTDSHRDIRVILHPRASIGAVRRKTSTDGVDLSPMLESGTQTAFDCNVTLKWNYELFGTKNQPRPNQVLEVQRLQNGVFQPQWIGIVDNISSYTIARGERSMQLTARTRDSLDMFREAKRVTPLFPMMTDIGYIVQRIALNVGLDDDEIVVPMTSITTAHTNTQLADMSAWEMLEAVLLPAGRTPFVDAIGRLRAAPRTLMGVHPDLTLPPEAVKRVQAQRQRAPASRVRVRWLDPVLKKNKQQGRKLATVDVTMGWFLPYWKKTVFFSDDETQRADETKMVITTSANRFTGKGFVKEKYKQTGQNKGLIELTNYAFAAVPPIILAWYLAHQKPDAVVDVHTHVVEGLVVAGVTGPPIHAAGAPPVTQPVGRRIEAAAQFSLMSLMILIGNGQYEIWGKPYEWMHARNTTEAFDISVPRWIDNPEDVETDFVMDEAHAQAIAIRELVFRSWSANKWSVEILDDPRIEFGDIIEFPDGSKIYVEDYSRQLGRGEEAIMSVSGFLLAGTGAIGQVVSGPNPLESSEPGDPGTPGEPGEPPDEEEGPDVTGPLEAPNRQSEVQKTIDEHPEIDTMGSDDERGKIINITCKRLNGSSDKPWGRKARQNDPANPNLNGDAICYMRSDGKFEIYDCISGGNGQSTWDAYGPFEMGQNGYWWPVK